MYIRTRIYKNNIQKNIIHIQKKHIFDKLEKSNKSSIKNQFSRALFTHISFLY